jgi:hypothetical protein
MKNRYAILVILSIIVLLIILYYWKSCSSCKNKSHKEGMENEIHSKKNKDDSATDIMANDEDPMNPTPEGLSLFGNDGGDKKHKKVKSTKKTEALESKKKEAFENYYHLSEGYNNLGVSICTNCKQPNNKANWSCNECRPPPKRGPMGSGQGSWIQTNNIGQKQPGANPYKPGAYAMRPRPNIGNNAYKSRTENFDNMSTNFNNIEFSNANSNDSISSFFKDVLFSTDCCPSSFSTDQGCACISPSQYNVLKTRAGNNIPYSEF